jgi:hypothetical protein
VIADCAGRSGRRLQITDFWLRFFGLALIVVGYFGPWVPHKTAALAVTGSELAEFAKFFPQVEGGVVPVARELFYLPLVTASILLGVMAARSTACAARLIVPLCAVALLLGMLFPYSVVDSARHALTTHSPLALDPQYTGQMVLVLVGTALTLLAPLAHRLPRRTWGILVALLALVGTVPTLRQFALLRPLVLALYGAPPGLGWGLIACVAGFVLLLICGIFIAASPARSAQPTSYV